jgi:hypothetical protein
MAEIQEDDISDWNDPARESLLRQSVHRYSNGYYRIHLIIIIERYRLDDWFGIQRRANAERLQPSKAIIAPGPFPRYLVLCPLANGERIPIPRATQSCSSGFPPRLYGRALDSQRSPKYRPKGRYFKANAVWHV